MIQVNAVNETDSEGRQYVAKHIISSAGGFPLLSVNYGQFIAAQIEIINAPNTKHISPFIAVEYAQALTEAVMLYGAAYADKTTDLEEELGYYRDDEVEEDSEAATD